MFSPCAHRSGCPMALACLVGNHALSSQVPTERMLGLRAGGGRKCVPPSGLAAAATTTMPLRQRDSTASCRGRWTLLSLVPMDKLATFILYCAALSNIHPMARMARREVPCPVASSIFKEMMCACGAMPL